MKNSRFAMAQNCGSARFKKEDEEGVHTLVDKTW